jgi:hypothetical protein
MMAAAERGRRKEGTVVVEQEREKKEDSVRVLGMTREKNWFAIVVLCE